MAFRAQFGGKCVTCGGRIRKGDLISGSTRNYSHVRCLAEAAEAEPFEGDAAQAEAERILAAEADREAADRAAWDEWMASYTPRAGEDEFSL